MLGGQVLRQVGGQTRVQVVGQVRVQVGGQVGEVGLLHLVQALVGLLHLMRRMRMFDQGAGVVSDLGGGPVLRCGHCLLSSPVGLWG